jgi:hypothetical protein
MLGDCLDKMAAIADGSVDMVLCDLPYGTTQNKWDAVIPFGPLWSEYERVCRGAIVLTATQPFASALVMSRPDWFRHQWVWDRVGKVSGHLNANRAPMRRHELILVFSSGKLTYNPIKTKGRLAKASGSTHKGETYGKHAKSDYFSSERYPVDILTVPADDARRRWHPTQKPVALFEYLVKTYTNEGDTVLDNTMGSGSTGVACINTGRKFIGIERDENYFAIAQRRIAEYASAGPLFAAAE